MKYFIDTEFLEGTQKERFPVSLFRKETKPTIDLISIGIVAEDGREYYAISKDFNLEEAWNRYDLEINKRFPLGGEYNKVYWIRENVLKPIFIELTCKSFKNDNYGINTILAKEIANTQFTYNNLKLLINTYGKTNKQIAEEIKEFCIQRIVTESNIEKLAPLYPTKNIPRQDINTSIDYPEFYGYYADYDWVAFCWLFGKMMDLPKGFPMYCIDLKQELDKKVLNHKQEWLANKVNIDFDMLTHIQTLPNYPKQTNEHNALADARWNKKLYEFLQTI
jgi:hypothetical protein